MPLLTRWHETYQIWHRGQWYMSIFKAKPYQKDPLFNVHEGQLRLWIGIVITTDVIVYKSSSEEKARELSSRLRYVQKIIKQQPELKRSLAVVRTWTQKVDSVEYFPFQRKTVRKEDTVVVQERVSGQMELVEYDDTQDISQFRQAYPLLASLVAISGRRSQRRRVISGLRAVFADGVYHLTFVTLRCCTEVRGGTSTEAPQSPRGPPGGASWEEMGVPDRSSFTHRLVLTVPELERLVPAAPDPEEDDPPTPPKANAWAGLSKGGLCFQFPSSFQIHRLLMIRL